MNCDQQNIAEIVKNVYFVVKMIPFIDEKAISLAFKGFNMMKIYEFNLSGCHTYFS